MNENQQPQATTGFLQVARTIEEAFPGMSAQEFNDKWWRAQDPRIRALRDLPYNARVDAASELLRADNSLKIDWPIAVSELEGTPYETTQQRMILRMTRTPIAKLFSGVFAPPIFSTGGAPGTIDVNRLGDSDSLPVPPDLTPFPDPPAAPVNEFVAGLYDAGRKLYNATARGWQAPEGYQTMEADGHRYMRVPEALLVPGDPEALYLRMG
jgi:hypothetical protein